MNVSGPAESPAAGSARSARIGYLVNQYPKISHTFIRTEITALESLGTVVERYSIRPSPDELIDPEDRLEQKRTRVLLRAGFKAALKSLAQAGVRPGSLTRAAALASRIGIKSDRGLGRHYVYLAEACILRAWARQASVHHIHAHFGTNPAAVAMLCHTLGGPGYSFTVHGPEEFDKPGLISLSTKLRHAAFAVAVSNYGRAQLWRHCPAAEWGKVHMIRCGVDPRFLREESTAVPDAPRLVCVGRLGEQKGQLVLLQAAAALKKEDLDFELVLVGDGEMRAELESAIGELGLRENVHITGWQSADQVRQHIQNSKAMVLPSFAEGLPVVIMEAMALHRPVISTYVAGIPELVTPGVTGWLVPAGAVAPLVEAMREALRLDPAQLAQMGHTGHSRVREQHDAFENARQLNALFAEVARA